MEQPIFEKFRSIIYRESGIVLPPEKLPLLSSRIQKRLSALGLENEGEYLKIIECDIDGSELTNLIDVVSTNVTHFYREEEHFAALRQIVTARVGKDRSTIKLWCAAASSGEEPYTLAFELSEALKAAQVDFKILATDICTRVLNHALRGSYESHAVNRIPPEIRNRYLKHDRSEELWQVAPEIMAKILFKKLNLVSFPYPLTGGFDVIFCRNVMIYFDKPNRQRVINEFWRLLRPGGYLFLSHSENLLGIEHTFSKVSGSIFYKN